MPRQTQTSSTPDASRPERRTRRELAADVPNTGGHSPADATLLPELDDGITLLDVEGDRGVASLQSLVLDQLLLHEGPAFWVDANGHARTTTLARIAPSRRLLDRIHVMRGFTAYQHYGAVCDLPTAVNRQVRRSATPQAGPYPACTESARPRTPALIVAPALDARYRDTDTLREAGAATLQARTLARLRTYAEGYDAPVLCTRTATDAFTDPIVTAADHRLRCEHTSQGPRFIGDDFETLVYPVGGGSSYQTTFAYWRQVVGARAAQLGFGSLPTTGAPDTSTDRPSGVGTAVTIDGTATTVSADPLRDALTATGAGASNGGR